MKQLSTTQDAYKLTHDGILALFKAEQQGMRIDVTYIEKEKKRLTKHILRLEAKLMDTPLVRQWKHIYGPKFSLTSGHQLRHILYKIKKLTPPKNTTAGLGSTDEESLRLLGIPELDILLKMRKYLKLRDTYLVGFLREQVNGYIHPSFNLHIAVTYRSSSDKPNFQNLPKRDKESMKIVRKGIFPRPGHQLMEVDFSKLEVSIAACYHKDPRMLEYLTSDSNDMHGDLAEQIFKVDNFDKHIPEHGYLRSAAKNGFIFPQFYGDYYLGNAESLRGWIKLGKGKWRKGQGVEMPNGSTIGTHMVEHGIASFDAFANYLKEIEYDFWHNRFAVYKQWKDKWLAKYQKKGYIDMLTGFRCTGVMRKNEVINYPVQGAAFHCLMWSFNRVTEIIEERGLDSKLIGQIHDAMVLDINPDEFQEVYDLLRDVTIKQLPAHWKWIIVPLDVEFEVCGVDEPWSIKEEYYPPK